MISDEMAYRQYLDGKEESADILVERYGDALTYYINGYIHDIHESEDLMIRHRQKHKIWFLHLDEVDFELPSEELVDAKLLQSEREQHLYEGMADLKTEYREVLYLVSLEGMSYREAARILGKSDQQVTNLVHRGKKSLKKILEERGFIYADE